MSAQQGQRYLFEEIKTDDLDEFVKKKFVGQEITYDKTVAKDGSVIFDLMVSGIHQRYTFTEI